MRFIPGALITGLSLAPLACFLIVFFGRTPIISLTEMIVEGTFFTLIAIFGIVIMVREVGSK